MNKKEVIRTAKAFKKILKKGIPQTVWKSSYWDIHGKRYTAYEIAARFLRMKGYNVRIEIGDNTENPSYCFGYIRYERSGRSPRYVKPEAAHFLYHNLSGQIPESAPEDNLLQAPHNP